MWVWQIALSSVFSLLVLFLLTKLMGNKQVAQMNAFDYVIGISIGSIAAEMATELEEPLKPLLAMGLYALTAFLISLADWYSPRARRLTDGGAVTLFDDGRLFSDAIRRARLDLSEFLALCRVGGYGDLSQLQTVMMEHNGALSFVPKASARPVTNEDLRVRAKQEYVLRHLVLDGRVLDHNLKAMGKDKNWLLKRLKEQGFSGYRDVYLATADRDEAVAVYPYEKKV